MPSSDHRVPDVDRIDDVRIPVGGEVISGTRYRPEDRTDPLPAIVMGIPYRKDDRIVFGSYYPSLAYLAANGYEVLAVDLLGTGASSGSKPQPREGEGEELATVIDWASDQPWCDGAVGMYGKSYGALTQLETAARQPEALKTIVPVMGTHTVYQSQYMNGAFKLSAMGKWYPEMQAWAALPPSYRDVDGRWADVWSERLEELRDRYPWLFQVIDHAPKDDYWQRKDVDVSRISVPALAVGGYRDLLTEGLVKWFDQLEAPKRMLLGPWRHTVPHRGVETAVDFRRQVVDWFDHFLKNVDNDVMEGPTVTYWTERDGGWNETGHWRGADRWPNVDDETLEYAVTPRGLEGATTFTEGSVKTEYEFDHTVGIHTMEQEVNVLEQPPDTTPDDVRSVVFETNSLDHPVEFTGSGAMTVRLRPTISDPVIAVRVSDVLPDGTARPVTTGHIQASHLRGHEEPEQLQPGDTYEVTIPLKPKSHVFESGHRIRVAISGSMFPRAMPAQEHGSFTILSTPDAPTLLSFPGEIYEESPSFDEIDGFESPEEEPIPTTSPYIVDSESDVRTIRHRSDTSGESGTYETAERYVLDLPHGPELTMDSTVRAEVATRDPSTASIVHVTDLTLDYGHETVEVENSGRVAQHTADLSTIVRVNGRVVFDEVWHR